MFILLTIFSVNAVITDNLLLYYEFNNNALDSSINSNNGISSTTYPLGKINLGAEFQFGIDTTIYLPYQNLQIGTSDFTINYWDKHLGQNNGFGYSLPIALGRGINIFYDYDCSNTNIVGSMCFQIYDGFEVQYLPISSNIATDTWHMFTFQRNANMLKVYIDGILFNSLPMTSTLNTNYNGNYVIGGNYITPSNQQFIGIIDEFAFWNREITEQEILNIYNNNLGKSFSELQNSLNIQINTPLENYNYTYDVTNIDLDLTTTINSNCSYIYNGTETLFSITNGLTHLTNFNLPVATTQNQEFNIEITCSDNTYSQSQNITFYKQQEPLNFQIYIPQDQQHFNFDTSVIEFYIETNYIADCNYSVYNMTDYLSFTSTGGSIHKTNYTAFYPNVNYYPVSFICGGVLNSEIVEKNVTFIIDSNNQNNVGFIEKTMVDTGNSFAGFFNSLFPSVSSWLIVLTILVMTLGIGTIIGKVIQEKFK